MLFLVNSKTIRRFVPVLLNVLHGILSASNSFTSITVSEILIFGCLQVEAALASEDYGRDLTSVQNLSKKHQLLEADVAAHDVSVLACGCLLFTMMMHNLYHNYELTNDNECSKILATILIG